MAIIRRRFVIVEGRRVHYLRSGEGPPVVLVHSSPANAWYLEPLIRQLSDRFTCFAFDSPGFGLSDALPGDLLSVADLSRALADNMAAVGIPPCPVFGTHTGAAIALSLAATQPHCTSGVVIDAVPSFNADEIAAKFGGYFEKLVLDRLGSHYTRTWTRFRDQFIWFPWTSKRPADLNPYGVGSAETIHGWVMSFFHAESTYGPAYRAAVSYGGQAAVDAAALTVPAVFTALESDMLYGHLDRLPALSPPQEIRRIGNDKALRDALTLEYFARYPSKAPAPAMSFEFARRPHEAIARQFIDLPSGQVLVRRAGPSGGLPIVLLHDAPGSAERIEGLIETLALDHEVVAPDLPGCGGSNALPGDPSIDDIAEALWTVLDAIGVHDAVIYGVGIGASVALAMAGRRPVAIQGLVLRGLLLPDAAQRADLRANYAPPITLQPDGAHWYRTWLMLRDQLIYFPWYDGQVGNLRRIEADFSAETLHRWTFDVMQQHAGYAQSIAAALDHDAAAALQSVSAPVLFCRDPQVPFSAFDERALGLIGDATDTTEVHRAALDALMERVAR